MKYSSTFICMLSFLFSVTGYEIAEQMSSRTSPVDIKSILIMKLEDKRGNTQRSVIKSHTKDSGKRQIIWFTDPPDNRGVSLLKIESDGGKDIMKMWLPAFRKIRRISSSKNSERFMGSDLTFEDLYNRELDDFSYSLKYIEQSDTYEMTSVPIESKESSYSKHMSWISRENLLIDREESYGKNGNVIKTKEFKYINVDGFDLVQTVVVHDIKRQHKTYLEFKDISINTGVAEAYFHEKNLKRIPTK